MRNKGSIALSAMQRASERGSEKYRYYVVVSDLEPVELPSSEPKGVPVDFLQKERLAPYLLQEATQ